MSAQPSLFDPQLPDKLEGLPLAVASVLLDNRGRWVKSKEIARMVGLRNPCDVRHICASLVDDYSLWVIGDRTRGFQLTADLAEFEEHQWANMRQAMTTFERVRSRLGERTFRRMLVRLKIREALSLSEETQG